MKTTGISFCITLALVLVAFTACEFGTDIDESQSKSVSRHLEWTQGDMDSPAVNGFDDSSGAPYIGDDSVPDDPGAPVTNPGDCLDISTGTLLIVPCLSVGARTGDTGHGDPQPWLSTAPTSVPQPY